MVKSLVMIVAPKNYETITIGDLEEDKSLKISSKLSSEKKESLIEFLKKNGDLFAQKPKDMPGINADIISKELKVYHNKKLIKQRKTRFV